MSSTDSDAAERIAACHGGARINCVVDGDTLWWRGEKIRMAGIDTPELEHPSCPGPAVGATAARDRLIALLNQPGRLSIARQGHDRYGRTLAVLTIGGMDLGMQLVDEGLARIYVPGERPWC